MFSLTHLLSRLALLAALLSLPLRADDTIYTKVDTPPVPTKTPPPDFPIEMKKQGISGVVVLAIVIDEQGLVTESKIVKSTHPEFDSPALEAVKKWKFKPAKKEGNAVKIRLNLPMRFDLE